MYNDLSGFGSQKQTLADAKQVDPFIKLGDVRQWMAENTKRKNQLPRQSSFVANGPYHEHQLDLMSITVLGRSEVRGNHGVCGCVYEIRSRSASER